MNKKLDISKLKFKEEYQNSVRIDIRTKSGKFATSNKENILKVVSIGRNKFELSKFFTEESIAAATKVEAVEAKKQIKKEKEDAKDSK